MVPVIFKYPLDLSGKSPNNKVQDEAHTIGAVRGRLFASNYGPFFSDSVVLVDGVTGRQLVPKVDYDLAHYYHEAAVRTAQGVYAAVIIKNPDVSTSILFTAQMVGGEFSYSYFAIKQAIEALQNDSRPIYWGDLIGVPSQFNPAPHQHSIYDTYRWEHMVWATNDVAAAIREGDAASRALLLSQIQDKLDEFDAWMRAQIALLQGQSGYTAVRADATLLTNRRYLILGNWTVTLPLIAGGVLDGDWIILAKRLSDRPVIKSTDQTIFCVNGTDTIHEGVLFDAIPEQKIVWNGPSQRWEI